MNSDLKTLQWSFKKKYPFKLGTTSFIYPDLYSENVRRLGPFLDEIELLFFESRDPLSMPSAYEIDSLRKLKEEFDVTYNIHLPTDVDIASPDPAERDRAAEIYTRVVDLTAPLDPTTFTLHVPYDSSKNISEDVWRTYSFRGMRGFLKCGVNPRKISIETLDYPAEILRPLLREFDLSMCLDVGHVILHGGDILSVFESFRKRISIIHLHGVHDGCDHMPLDLSSRDDMDKILAIMNQFKGTVSVEVFSFERLERSLFHFGRMV